MSIFSLFITTTTKKEKSYIYFLNIFVYFSERETEPECEWGRDKETGRHRI